jgi:hypothetical protein
MLLAVAMKYIKTEEDAFKSIMQVELIILKICFCLLWNLQYKMQQNIIALQQNLCCLLPFLFIVVSDDFFLVIIILQRIF